MKENLLEIKLLDNLQPRKFNKKYVEKFVTLLNKSKSLKPSYSVERKKLKLNPIKKNKVNKGGIYITLPKLNDNESYQNINTYEGNKEEYSLSFPQNLLEDEQNNKNDYNSILTDTIRDILYKDDKTNLDLDSYGKKEKLLYEILKTKKQFHKNTNKIYSPTEGNELSNSNNINIIKNRKLFMSPNLRNFEYNLAKSLEKENYKNLSKNEIQNNYFLIDLKLFDFVNKMREKNKILNEMKNQQKRRYLKNTDMFKYNKEKWDKNRKALNKNINNILFNKFNLDNKRYLKDMRTSVDKLHDHAKYIESDLGHFLNDLNDFIDKNSEYIKKNSQSNKESRFHSKRNSFMRKERLSLKNSNPLFPVEN